MIAHVKKMCILITTTSMVVLLYVVCLHETVTIIGHI